MTDHSRMCAFFQLEDVSMLKKIVLALAFMMPVMANAQVPQLREDNVDEVLKAMTLREKAQLVVGTGWGSMFGVGLLNADPVEVRGAAGMTRSVKRLGVPSVVMADGPAGLRIMPGRSKRYCTGFPVGTLLACSWDTALVQEVGAAMGQEVLEYGVDIILAPGMNLMRNPLCGRNFEYYSEDPLLTGKIAAAMIRGIQSQGVGTSAKHFAANSQETNRTGNNAIVEEDVLRALYLKGFEIAVKEAQPWTIMSSYNKLNGPYTQEDKWLLTDVLRDEWGFEGLVMTDWTSPRNTPAQIAAGNDLMEPGFKKQINQIVKAVKKGELDEALLDVCAKRVLELVVKTPRFHGYQYSNQPDLKSHAEVSRRAAADGMVLLENRSALPLQGVKKVALLGVGSYDIIAGGTGSGNVNKPYVVNLMDGLKNAGIAVDEGAAADYLKYISHNSNRKKGYVMVGKAAWKEKAVPVAQIKSLAMNNDAAVITIIRQAGEGEDRSVNDDFCLDETELALIGDVCREFHAVGKKVTVVLNIGGVVETASWKQLPDAILVAWGCGQEGGNAIADVLTGAVNPSGKLSMTFPLAYEDVPSSANFPLGKKEVIKDVMSTATGASKDKGRKDVDYTVYEEGMNVGYRYFGLDGTKVSYPFGYGLSYTTFSKEELEDGSVIVTNTGARSGREVVMRFEDGILSAFAKTRLLAPGESETLKL